MMRMGSAFVLLSVACADGPERERVVVENAGRVCVFASQPGFEQLEQPSGRQSFVAGQPAYVRYFLEQPCPPAELSGCAQDHSAQCSVTADNLSHRSTSTFSWLDTSEPDKVCRSICSPLAAVCESVPLTEGKHIFVFGDKSLSIQIPSEHLQPPCITL